MIEDVGFTEEATARKRRGAFFTPAAVAEYMVDWAVRSPSDRVLEPSCGDAAFLVPAVTRLKSLGALGRPLVQGIDIDLRSVRLALEATILAGGDPKIQTADFFDVPARRQFDVVIGNPPFIRFHLHAGAVREKSLRAASNAGVTLSGLASSWAAFVAHSTQFLVPGGRLAMVLPGELLSVDYAAEIRGLLLSSFGSIEIVAFSSPVFPGVQTDVVLVLAVSYGGSSSELTIRDAASASSLSSLPVARKWRPSETTSKWTPARSQTALNSEVAPEGFVRFAHWGLASIGVVTGRNSFFALTEADVERAGLRIGSLAPLAPPMKPDARGLNYTESDWQNAQAAGKAVWLFSPNSATKEDGAYIAGGVAEEVQEAYKCRSRTPWWQVPKGVAGELMVTYMSAGIPRIVGNPHGYLHLNSVHRVVVNEQLKEAAVVSLPAAALCSVTTLGAELLGRSYGGGVLKLEIGELRSLPIVSDAVLARSKLAIEKERATIDAHLRGGQPDRATAIVDDIVLRGVLGWSKERVKSTADTAREMRVSRQQRSRSI